MKKTGLILPVIFAATFDINAQIPNSGFENWISSGLYEEPIGWATMNSASQGPFYSCTKSNDHYPASVGNYSIRVENNTSLTQFTGGYGMAITDRFAYPFQPAFPIFGNPTSLCGYYKFNSLNNDSMFIRIVFFENGTMLGYNTFITGVTTTEWTSFVLPLSYPVADSATLYFSAFYPGSQTDGPKGNSVLYIDNLSFDTLISSSFQPEANNNLFSLFPNPASNLVNLYLHNSDNAAYTLHIYNAIGSLLKSEKLDINKPQINIKDLPPGIYFLSLTSKDFSENKRLVIQK